MTAASNRTTLPRPFFVLGIPVAALLLIGFFVYLGFPYSQLGDRISTEIRKASGIRVDFDDISASLHLAGPGLEATGVRATLADGQVYLIERAMVRPAWSLAWFRGMPALYAEITSDLGDVAGTLMIGSTGGFDGALSQVAVARLPIPGMEAVGNLDTRLDAEIDLALAEAGPIGSVEFSGTEGSVGLAHFPMDIPFEKITGDLIFGGEQMLEIKQLELVGPMLDATLTGTVLHGPSFAEAPLRLEASLVSEANIRPALKTAGVRVDREGNSKVRFTGTVGAPIVR